VAATVPTIGAPPPPPPWPRPDSERKRRAMKSNSRYASRRPAEGGACTPLIPWEFAKTCMGAFGRGRARHGHGFEKGSTAVRSRCWSTSCVHRAAAKMRTIDFILKKIDGETAVDVCLPTDRRRLSARPQGWCSSATRAEGRRRSTGCFGRSPNAHCASRHSIAAGRRLRQRRPGCGGRANEDWTSVGSATCCEREHDRLPAVGQVQRECRNPRLPPTAAAAGPRTIKPIEN